jgi:hypothetical protein
MAVARKRDIPLGIKRLESFGGETREAVLQIETSKGYTKGVESDATVFWVGGGCRSRMIGLGNGPGSDYSLRVQVDRNIRATQQAIDRQHAGVFTPERVSEIVEAAKLHYADVIRTGVDGFGNTFPQEG